MTTFYLKNKSKLKIKIVEKEKNTLYNQKWVLVQKEKPLKPKTEKNPLFYLITFILRIKLFFLHICLFYIK